MILDAIEIKLTVTSLGEKKLNEIARGLDRINRSLRRASDTAPRLAKEINVNAEYFRRTTADATSFAVALDSISRVSGKTLSGAIRLTRAEENLQRKVAMLNFDVARSASGLQNLARHTTTGVRALDMMAYTLDQASMFMWKFMIGAIPLGRIGDFFLMIAGGAAAATAAIANVGSTFESIELQLEGVTHSALEASMAMEQAKEFAARTPFDIKQVSQARQVLQRLGGDQEKLIESAAKLAAGTMGAGHDIWRASEAMVDAVYGDFRRLRNTYHITKEDVRAYAKDSVDAMGRIVDRQKFLTGIMMVINDRFGRALEKYPRTLEGMYSNLKDVLYELFEAITQVIAPVIKDMLTWLRDLFERIKNFISKNAVAIATLREVFRSIIKPMTLFAIAIGAIAKGAGGFIYVLGLLGAVLRSINSQTWANASALAKLAQVMLLVSEEEARRIQEALDQVGVEELYQQEIQRRIGAEKELANTTDFTGKVLAKQREIMRSKAEVGATLSASIDKATASEIAFADAVARSTAASQAAMLSEAQRAAAAMGASASGARRARGMPMPGDVIRREIPLAKRERMREIEEQVAGYMRLRRQHRNVAESLRILERKHEEYALRVGDLNDRIITQEHALAKLYRGRAFGRESAAGFERFYERTRRRLARKRIFHMFLPEGTPLRDMLTREEKALHDLELLQNRRNRLLERQAILSKYLGEAIGMGRGVAGANDLGKAWGAIVKHEAISNKHLSTATRLTENMYANVSNVDREMRAVSRIADEMHHKYRNIGVAIRQAQLDMAGIKATALPRPEEAQKIARRRISMESVMRGLIRGFEVAMIVAIVAYVLWALDRIITARIAASIKVGMTKGFTEGFEEFKKQYRRISGTLTEAQKTAGSLSKHYYDAADAVADISANASTVIGKHKLWRVLLITSNHGMIQQFDTFVDKWVRLRNLSEEVFHTLVALTRASAEFAASPNEVYAAYKENVDLAKENKNALESLDKIHEKGVVTVSEETRILKEQIALYEEMIGQMPHLIGQNDELLEVYEEQLRKLNEEIARASEAYVAARKTWGETAQITKYYKTILEELERVHEELNNAISTTRANTEALKESAHEYKIEVYETELLLEKIANRYREINREVRGGYLEVAGTKFEQSVHDASVAMQEMEEIMQRTAKQTQLAILKGEISDPTGRVMRDIRHAHEAVQQMMAGRPLTDEMINALARVSSGEDDLAKQMLDRYKKILQYQEALINEYGQMVSLHMSFASYYQSAARYEEAQREYASAMNDLYRQRLTIMNSSFTEQRKEQELAYNTLEIMRTQREIEEAHNEQLQRQIDRLNDIVGLYKDRLTLALKDWLNPSRAISLYDGIIDALRQVLALTTDSIKREAILDKIRENNMKREIVGLDMMYKYWKAMAQIQQTSGHEFKARAIEMHKIIPILNQLIMLALKHRDIEKATELILERQSILFKDMSNNAEEAIGWSKTMGEVFGDWFHGGLSVWRYRPSNNQYTITIKTDPAMDDNVRMVVEEAIGNFASNIQRGL